MSSAEAFDVGNSVCSSHFAEHDCESLESVVCEISDCSKSSDDCIVFWGDLLDNVPVST